MSFDKKDGESFTTGYCWRGGRAVECGGLENRYAVLSGIQGSNPCPSAIKNQTPTGVLFFIGDGVADENPLWFDSGCIVRDTPNCEGQGGAIAPEHTITT